MTPKTRCLCGATRAKFDAHQILWSALCHCESCRRAAGAPVVGWFGVANGAWSWAGAPPSEFESSPGVVRRFCTTCGSPVAFSSERWPGETHFPAASLENPEDFDAQLHCWTQDQMDWLKIEDALPNYAQSAPSVCE